MPLSRKKNDEALEHFFLRAYDQYSAQILRHISFRVSDADTAKDITAEVFMKTWQYLRAGNEVRDVKSFFYKISNNAIIDHYRSRRTGIIPLHDLPEIAEPQVTDLEENLDTQTISFEILHNHLNALPPDHREILLYRYVDELDIGEIRELTGKSMSNIYTILHRALKALKKKLSES